LDNCRFGSDHRPRELVKKRTFMSEIYIFSGLGADERVFQNLDFGKHSVTFINWIIPEKNETIERYASRIRRGISSPNPILVGLSFGGIMAIEVSKQIPVEKIILISSAKNRYEIPWYYRFIGRFRLNRLVPVKLLRSANRLTYWFFGTSTAEEKRLLKIILKETDGVYLNWAIEQVLRWKNLEHPKKPFHIHGTRDHVLPLPPNVDKIIEGGGHFMLLNKSDEVNDILNEVLL